MDHLALNQMGLWGAIMRHRTLWVALGLAEAKSQHDPLEAEALSRWAEGKRTLLEIGVAEGASALVLRRSMDPTGKLWKLVDPSHLSRNPVFNTGLRAARRTLAKCRNGSVYFLQSLSVEALASWMALPSTWSSSTAIIRTRLFAQTGRVVEVRSAKRALAFHDAISALAIPKALVPLRRRDFREDLPGGLADRRGGPALSWSLSARQSREHRIPRSFQSVCAGEAIFTVGLTSTIQCKPLRPRGRASRPVARRADASPGDCPECLSLRSNAGGRPAHGSVVANRRSLLRSAAHGIRRFAGIRRIGRGKRRVATCLALGPWLERQPAGRVGLTQRRGVVVGGSRLEIGGGVVAVCREIMAALREEDWDVRYLSADARMERSLLASLPLQRGWGSSASAALVASEARALAPKSSSRMAHSRAGIHGRDLSVHFYHGTYRGQARPSRHTSLDGAQ